MAYRIHSVDRSSVEWNIRLYLTNPKTQAEFVQEFSYPLAAFQTLDDLTAAGARVQTDADAYLVWLAEQE